MRLWRMLCGLPLSTTADWKSLECGLKGTVNVSGWVHRDATANGRLQYIVNEKCPLLWIVKFKVLIVS